MEEGKFWFNFKTPEVAMLLWVSSLDTAHLQF